MTEPVPLAVDRAEALLRVIEGAPDVRRRYHFFVWTQGTMQGLLPHQLAICGAYQRQRKTVVFEAFHSVAVPATVLDALTDGRSALMQAAQAAWVAHRGRPLRVGVESLAQHHGPFDAGAILSAGYRHLLLHGVSRPQRPAEIETFFLLASPERLPADSELTSFEVILPYLHSAYLRVQAMEQDLAVTSLSVPMRGLRSASIITAREKQILRGVRDGKNNQQIGEVLAISPLTVKNHVQKILRKLDATNRAQAVAKAMALQLLAGSSIDGETSRDV